MGYAFGEDRKSISIMPLKSTGGISNAELISLSVILEASFTSTGVYRIIASETRDTILEEQSFSMSGCSDQACAVEIGKLLSADYLVIGTITKNGPMYLESINLISVESGEIVKNAMTVLKSLISFEELTVKNTELAESIALNEIKSADKRSNETYIEEAKIDEIPHETTDDEIKEKNEELYMTEVEPDLNQPSYLPYSILSTSNDYKDMNSIKMQIENSETKIKRLNVLSTVFGISSGISAGGTGVFTWQAFEKYKAYSSTEYSNLAVDYRESVNNFTTAGIVSAGLFLTLSLVEVVIIAVRKNEKEKLDELKFSQINTISDIGAYESMQEEYNAD